MFVANFMGEKRKRKRKKTSCYIHEGKLSVATFMKEKLLSLISWKKKKISCHLHERKISVANFVEKEKSQLLHSWTKNFCGYIHERKSLSLISCKKEKFNFYTHEQKIYVAKFRNKKQKKKKSNVAFTNQKFCHDIHEPKSSIVFFTRRLSCPCSFSKNLLYLHSWKTSLSWPHWSRRYFLWLLHPWIKKFIVTTEFECTYNSRVSFINKAITIPELCIIFSYFRAKNA